MKNIHKSLWLLILFLSSQIRAENYQNLKLSEVNSHWLNYKGPVPNLITEEALNQADFNTLISLHLKSLVLILKEKDSQQWNNKQLINRYKLLNELDHYAEKAVFPFNNLKPFKTPVFIDQNGTHCAVGYLMQQSGFEDLAQKINSECRFCYLKDIQTPGVLEWASEHGFTTEELAWIQPGYPAIFSVSNFGNGLNGSVYTFYTDSVNIYAGGDFTQNNSGQILNHVALLNNLGGNTAWVNLSSGFNGPVYTLMMYQNKLYAGGEFTQAGTANCNNIACYDFQLQQWQNAGSLDGKVNNLTIYNGELYAGGQFTDMFKKLVAGQWVSLAPSYLYGESVRTMEVFNGLLYLGGKFELPTGALRKNTIVWDGTQFVMPSPFGPNPVNDYMVYNNHLIAATDFVEYNDSSALSYLNSNGVWTTIIKPDSAAFGILSGSSFNCFYPANGSIYCGGNFSCNSGLYFGSNLAEIYLQGLDSVPAYNIYPRFSSNGTVYSLCNYNQHLCAGGSFTFSPPDSISYSLKFDDIILSSNTNVISNIYDIRLYPNPSNGLLNFTCKENTNIKQINIYNSNGQLVKKTIVNNNKELDLSELISGYYFAEFITENDKIHLPLVMSR